MTVLVFGGSSQIGHFLLPRLLASGEPVLALSRQSQPAQAGVNWLWGALPADVPTLPPLSAIISFGPLLELAEWLAQTRLIDAPRVIAVSSMSAETKRDSSVPAEREISRQLHQGEAALAAACARHGCAWTVLRPTLVYGAGLDKSLTPIVRRALRLRLFPLPAGRGLRQPVHADDIAQTVLAALDCPAASGRILPIGGGERLPAGEMFARVRRSLPQATVPLPLPAWLLRLGQRTLPPLRGPLSRLDSDLIADNGELQRLLGIHPRPFRPEASMWMSPL
ncbi:NAD-dependent epimerase/dehydratase family protein [Rhodanobacter glycinis]|uniref:NAD-dependent epimerase/dehydratase family protein n=1 Tax=Rhodanobacter glycinis TaxID=582702 RepID=A0A502C3E4_9GAMM|nr:NAD-dependent epimerase/dehydratase family protein [Rhodanobacter glycinis]TPG07262.1 NAD-dependent epimerase/dehydratase family protein [Rhodanobacter glycinis]